jgi:tetratricopeptide (TPR) repeat protein
MIADDSLVFIACFSQASAGRPKSYQRREILLAVEQLQLRQPDDPWLIPVRFDECVIPDYDLGGGATLASIQRADLFGERHDENAGRLVEAVLRLLSRPGSSALRAHLPRGPGRDRWSAPPEVRFSLPPDAPAFTGREDELGRIISAVSGGDGESTVVSISGMPGIGKTALAVHAAHLLREQFPERQLCIDLRAHTLGHDPLTSEAALAELLAATGVDPRSMPGDLPARAALWRDRMAGQRSLLVLDNVVSSAQITPLVPGGACRVLITSRRHLADLPGAVCRVPVEVLPSGHAQEMFLRLAPRSSSGPAGAVEELAALAGCLPLAISLLARVHDRHPSWSMSDLIVETRQSVLLLKAEHDTVAAAFAVSYNHLPPGQQTFFRRIGLHLGTTTDAYAAAALAGVSVQEAASLLDALHGEGLLAETSYRRYGMHDLTRRFARDQAETDVPSAREQAVDRLLDYYQHAAARADVLLAREPRPSPARGPTAPSAEVPAMSDQDRALAWARAERASLLACVEYATQAGKQEQMISLTAAITGLLRRDGPWHEAASRHDAAARTAHRLGDRRGEADALTSLGIIWWLAGDYASADRALTSALNITRTEDVGPTRAYILDNLGIARYLSGDYPSADQVLTEALDLSHGRPDQRDEARALRDLATVRTFTGNRQEAARMLTQALDLFRDLGDRGGQASVLRMLAATRYLDGDHHAATPLLEEALSIARLQGDDTARAGALNILGAVREAVGDYTGAARAQEEALEIFRRFGDRRGEAGALNNRGIVLRKTADYAGASQDLEEALRIFRDIGDRPGMLEALCEIGALNQARGNPAQAKDPYQEALALSRQAANPRYEAHALAGLARCALAETDTAAAADGLRQALMIFQRIGAAEADGVKAELESLSSTQPPPHQT